MKDYLYFSRVYPVHNKENQYFEPKEHKCLTLPIPIFKPVRKSNEKIIYGSLHYFEPINNYQSFSILDVKDLSIENENFIDIYVINKTNHKIVIKNELIGFIYQNDIQNISH